MAKKRTKETPPIKEDVQIYDENSIMVLEGLDAVRKRPGMYIGSTDEKGLHHLIHEILDNSIDEALAGHGKEIIVTLNANGSVSVEDFGRGIPVGTKEQLGKSALEILCTVLHSGGKFNTNSYNKSGGLHGVGLSVVNALSSEMEVVVQRDGAKHRMSFVKGVSKKGLEVLGTSKKTGTKITFLPDPQVMKVTTFNKELLVDKLEQMTYLMGGIKIVLHDKRTKPVDTRTFHNPKGIVAYVERLNEGKETLHTDVIHLKGEGVLVDGRELSVELALQYTDGIGEQSLTFVNNIPTIGGGRHETGFRTALTKTLNTIGRSKRYLKVKDKNLDGADVREGLTVVLSVYLAEPEFEGQTKEKLSNPEVSSVVDGICTPLFSTYFEKKAKLVDLIVKRAQRSARAKEVFKQSRQLNKSKTSLDFIGTTGKIARCSGKDPMKNELFIVEGDSAGGSAKSGRDRSFQSIISLRGKPLNTQKARITDVMKNEEIRALISSIGAGIGKEFDIEKRNYDKIVIMTDADVDGEHIRTLLILFFFKFMRPLLEQGKIYVALPPLYEVATTKEKAFAYSDKERDLLIKKFGGVQKTTIKRFKGLGEMDAPQLWDTTMDPERRVLLQLQLTDETTDEMILMLMGDDVPPRRDFIMNEAALYRVETE